MNRINNIGASTITYIPSPSDKLASKIACLKGKKVNITFTTTTTSVDEHMSGILTTYSVKLGSAARKNCNYNIVALTLNDSSKLLIFIDGDRANIPPLGAYAKGTIKKINVIDE